MNEPIESEHTRSVNETLAIYATARRMAFGKLDPKHEHRLEKTVGKTRTVLNTISAEVEANLPPDLESQVSGLDRREPFWASRIVPGHFRCWVRIPMAENETGSWVYFEAEMKPALLAFPASKSCLAFVRVLLGAYSLGRQINPNAKAQLDREFHIMTTPGIQWKKPQNTDDPA